ncbi:hypothetical protein ACLRGI_15235 [Paenarthrobacter nitroguajacolicus]|uniref:hypothetical protein n=1 Tax=Paenarthrobacter nitroguajacolicus TaxID=211146 RepID=UPI003ADC419F
MLGTGSRHLGKLPHDMRLSVENHAQPVKMLLFIHFAWSLSTEANLPDLSPVPKTGSSALPDDESKQIWEDRWEREWRRVWAWYDSREAQEASVSQEEMIRISSSGQQLHPVIPPFWVTEYGWAGIDKDAFMKWDRLTTAVAPTHYPKLPLVDAWKAGINAITVLPYSGYFATRRNSTHLVVSDETMLDPKLFLKALDEQP